MKHQNYNILGVMSGTSLDGIDLCYITFVKNESWEFKIHQTKTYKYSNYWNNKLKYLIGIASAELKPLNINYTNYLGEVINTFIDESNLGHIDAICSHGHTALHQPEADLTLQIGNLKHIAEIVKQTVVCDFRVQDVKLGGQGAPLVPIGDQLLFSDYDACINLGGFSNISKTINNQRIAYDICPVNIVLNHYVSALNLDYDHNGELASKGTINQDLLSELNQLKFYKIEAPKSLGLEWVQDKVFPIIDKFNLTTETILRTCVEHFAIQIANNIDDDNKVLFTGGGVYNGFLMERIKTLSQANICIPDAKLIEFKEALIFGFLGVLKLRNENNCLASVTGAKKDHSSGEIYTYKP